MAFNDFHDLALPPENIHVEQKATLRLDISIFVFAAAVFRSFVTLWRYSVFATPKLQLRKTMRLGVFDQPSLTV